ncbi:MAG: N-acetylmuramoyl-L-alanine amidase [Flavobacteriales bacterium]|nr:N-acetylmuramoyl-L-alanine amidase [Flavobacteriales bacterium]
MSKLTKLYHIILSNASWMFLLVIVLSNSSFTNDKTTSNKLKTIVIDPGHGGHDPGNLGTGRYKKTEKHIALAISLKVGELIKQNFPEIEIIYTRDTDDDFLKLGARTQLANDKNADLFISVHCDAFTNPKAYGAGVYVMGMSKLKANMDVAMKENAVIYLEDDYKENYEGFDPNTPESYIVFSLTQNTHLDQSLQLAEEVEQQFATRANRKSRGVKQAPFYVISRANMPSILIECGFLTNPDEEDFLHSEKGQEYMSSAIFRAFRTYKESVEGVESDDEKETNVPIEVEVKKTIVKEERKIVLIPDKVIFKVQIGTYLKSMLSDKTFTSIHAEEEIVNGTYKYYVGSENDKNKADIIKTKMRENGFKGAFVVAFYKDKRISMKEALDLQTK